MKKLLLNLAIGATFLTLPVAVFAQSQTISQTDLNGINDTLNQVIESLNFEDKTTIESLIVPENQALKQDIEDNLPSEPIIYQIEKPTLNENIAYVGPDQIRFDTVFYASGLSWETHGLPIYFVFEKQNGQWLISDTNFYTKLGFNYALKTIKTIALITVPISLVLFAFWTWMFIDAMKRQYPNKGLWIILLLLFNILAAIPYFFMVKRKKQNLPSQPIDDGTNNQIDPDNQNTNPTNQS